MSGTKPRKLSAMELLVKSDALKPALSQQSALSRNAVANLREGVPVEISPAACRPWKLADRPEAESGHSAELAQSFQDPALGQLQPVVVRPFKDALAPEIEYEVICGCVRWRAARDAGLPLKAIVRELDDRAAYAVMSAENRQRRSLSDWAKARSYRQALDAGVFEGAAQLAEAEGISRSRLSLYLGFAELPTAVADAFANLAGLSYRTGYALARAVKALGEEAILGLVPKIEAGEIGRDDLERMVASAPETASNPEPEVEANRKAASAKKALVSSTGVRLFTYSQAGRGWLIRIDPALSSQVDEDLLREIGGLIESRLRQG
jgi:ParB/RepB/Spo0J family partition protein